MMTENNRDVFPTEATRNLYAQIRPLLENSALEAAFQRHEALAMKAKRRYHRIGRFAIFLIALSAIYTVAEALVVPAYSGSGAVSLLMVCLAAIGIFLQILIIATRQKEAWLLNRYAVERLRSINFQAFQTAQGAGSTAELAEAVRSFTARELTRLENDLNAGISVLRAFVPDEAYGDIGAPASPADKDISRQAFEAYADLRITYQKRFADSELASLGSRRRVLNSSQDMIYLAAAAFAFLSLVLKLFGQWDSGLQTNWLDFIAVTLFIVGATEAILDNASIEEQSQTRFEQYVRDINQVLSASKARDASLPEIISRMERLCLHELDSFCRASERISYRM